MEGNPSGMNNGNGGDPSSGSAWIYMNLPYFIGELCKIAKISTTGISIFSQGVGEKILQALRQRQNEFTRFERFMQRLCAISGVSTDGEDICSQSFMESLLEYIRQDLLLVERIRTKFAERRPFPSGTGGVGNPETQPSSVAYQSNGQSSSSESSEMAPNENNEIPTEMDSATEDVKVFPVVSQIIPIGTSSVPIISSPSLEVMSMSTTSAWQQSPSSPPCVLSASETASSGNNNDNMNTNPVLSPNLPEEDDQTASPSLQDLGQPQRTNEAEVGTGSVAVGDNMLNGVIPTPSFPSTSPQLPRNQNATTQGKHAYTARRKNNKDKRKRRVYKKKLHANHGFFDGFSWCSCGSKFSTKVAQMHHIKRLNAQWKFNCEKCQKKCYNLTSLKQHLKKEHGVEKPLKEFAIGCTLCGVMFKTRMEFTVHKKTVHNIHKVPKPRRSCMPSRPSSPILSSPPDVKMEGVDDDTTQEVPRLSNQNDVIDLVSEEESDNVGEGAYFSSMIHGNHPPSPPQINGIQTEGEPSSVETSAGLNGHNGRRDYGECYGCIMCTLAFRDLQQLRGHLLERHQSSRLDVKCSLCESKSGIICGRVFGSCKSFHTRRNKCHCT